jgi:cyclophilin family peptidyl-prolyl cis-trans isomerase
VGQQYPAPPDLTIDLAKSYSATLATNHGHIEIELHAMDTPQAVNNFVFLANEGFYDGVIFHRVVPGFVIQGGDPTGTGRGGPGYKFRDELEKAKPYSRGTVAMANAGPNTNGSQFFVTVAATPWLTGKHTIFGEVTEGMDVVSAISTTETGAQDRPAEDVVLDKVEITED